jgi:hypothetical protein
LISAIGHRSSAIEQRTTINDQRSTNNGQRSTINDHHQLLHSLQQQIAVGDQRAFRQLFDYYAEKLTRFAFSILKNKEAATEVVDEVFVKIWKQRDAIIQIQHLTTYLYTATKTLPSIFFPAKRMNRSPIRLILSISSCRTRNAPTSK